MKKVKMDKNFGKRPKGFWKIVFFHFFHFVKIILHFIVKKLPYHKYFCNF
jgi:hypothetical protein